MSGSRHGRLPTVVSSEVGPGSGEGQNSQSCSFGFFNMFHIWDKQKIKHKEDNRFCYREPWDKTPVSYSHAAELRSKIPCVIPTVFSCVSRQVPCNSSLLSAGQTLSFSLYLLVQWGSDKGVLNDFTQGCESQELDLGLSSKAKDTVVSSKSCL